MVRQAGSADTSIIIEILYEAAHWLRSEGMSMWKDDELESSTITADVQADLYFICERDGQSAGIMRFQLEDPMFWPDVPEGEAAYVHRLAVRRNYAGTGVSIELLSWAVERTRSLGRRWLRLDCEADRPKLRAFYERFGFRHHSKRQVGPHFVARYEYTIAN